MFSFHLFLLCHRVGRAHVVSVEFEEEFTKRKEVCPTGRVNRSRGVTHYQNDTRNKGNGECAELQEEAAPIV